MNFITFLVSLSAMVMAVSCSCNKPCKYVTEKPCQYSVKHVSTELQNNSMAPWSYRISSEEGRFPETISFAVCTTCNMENMVARSIFLKIWVFQMLREHQGWCRCPYELAVGCTCVMKNDPSM